ncbi:MAG: 16S rRNA processing protein RimM [Campylobacteraceae bacterium]|jgi:16S rRNA processing protein RimM|nr:16S rRNA processing protein RimM [Campylobacteraceae bacterium]MBT7117571.1 16S rRNA processing protein RimM [Campylobacteraceae bacterium]
MKTQNKIYIAKIGKAVGLQGELKLHLDTDFPEQFKAGATFTLSNNQEVTIEHFNNKRGVVKFKDYNDCEIVKKLINKEVFTDANATREKCNLSKTQYFWFDIIGATIIEDNKILGTVKDISRLPITDYLEVTTSEELTKQNLPQVFMIPYLDQYILNVDTEQKIITTSKAFEILENS